MAPKPAPRPRVCPIWGAAGLFVLACGSAVAPCRVPSDCAQGTECLANSCRPLGSVPVSPLSTRWVLHPQRVRYSRVATDRVIDLAFSLPNGDAPLAAAFLVIAPSKQPPEPRQISNFEVRLLIDPWPEAGASTPSVNLQQRAGISQVRGTASRGAVARIDVTPLLDRWLAVASSGYGLRVVAREERGGEPVDAELSAPIYLELYTSPKPRAGQSE